MASMSFDKLYAVIDDGHGQGHWDDYKPWLWVHRKNSSPRSNQHVARVPGYRRRLHFFASQEREIALLCKHLGGPQLDVREQFPMWPMKHDHPLTVGPSNDRYQRVRGLLEISEEAGIDHGWYVGAPHVPYVASMDLMCSVHGKTATSIHGLSIKPHEKVKAAEPTDRILERHELERRYMNEIGGSFKIVDRSIINRTFWTNLRRAADAALNVPLEGSCQIVDFFGEIERLAQLGFSEAIRLASSCVGIPYETAQSTFFAGVWHRRIPIDMSQPLAGRQPIHFDRGMADEVCVELFGYRL